MLTENSYRWETEQESETEDCSVEKLIMQTSTGYIVMAQRYKLPKGEVLMVNDGVVDWVVMAAICMASIAQNGQRKVR